MLPLPTVPNLDVDAERLRGIRAPAEIDVAAAAPAAVSGAMALQKALTEGKEKEAAYLFQKDYLDKGNEGIDKLYAEAGSPKDINVEIYKIPAGTKPEKAREMVEQFAKEVTGYKSRNAVADAIKAEGGDKVEEEAIRSGARSTDKALDQRETSQRAADKGVVSEKIANIRATASKATAQLRQAVAGARDESVISAIENEQESITALEATLTDAEAAYNALTPAEKKKDKVLGPRIARAEREMAESNSRISGFIAKLKDPSKVPKRGAPKDDPKTIKMLTDPAKAKEYLTKAGGDKAKARELARKDGWEF